MKKVLYLFCALALLASIFACSHNLNEEDSILLQLDTKASFSETLIDSTHFIKISNHDNPFEIIGTMHNELMDSIRINQITIDSLNNFVYRYAIRKGVISNSTFDKKLYNGTFSRMQNLNHNIFNNQLNQDSLMRQLPISSQRYVITLENFLENDDIDQEFVDSWFSDFHCQINKDAYLNDTEKYFLLAASAIASATYKANKIEGKVSSNRADKVVKADFWGGVGGFIVGAISGKYAAATYVFGPKGLVVSIAGDVFLGATVSSGIAVVVN